MHIWNLQMVSSVSSALCIWCPFQVSPCAKRVSKSFLVKAEAQLTYAPGPSLSLSYLDFFYIAGHRLQCYTQQLPYLVFRSCYQEDRLLRLVRLQPFDPIILAYNSDCELPFVSHEQVMVTVGLLYSWRDEQTEQQIKQTTLPLLADYFYCCLLWLAVSTKAEALGNDALSDEEKVFLTRSPLECLEHHSWPCYVRESLVCSPISVKECDFMFEFKLRMQLQWSSQLTMVGY